MKDPETISHTATARSVSEQEEFANDHRLIDLYNLIISTKNLRPERDGSQIILISSQMSTLTNTLNSVYGEDDVNYYLTEFISTNRPAPMVIAPTTGGGDKCHRNSNGTVNSDGCSFWESVLCGFKAAFRCGSMPSTSNQATINNWYDCVQGVNCETC